MGQDLKDPEFKQAVAKLVYELFPDHQVISITSHILGTLPCNLCGSRTEPRIRVGFAGTVRVEANNYQAIRICQDLEACSFRASVRTEG